MSFATDLFTPPSMWILIGLSGNFIWLCARRIVWCAALCGMFSVSSCICTGLLVVLGDVSILVCCGSSVVDHMICGGVGGVVLLWISYSFAVWIMLRIQLGAGSGALGSLLFSRCTLPHRQDVCDASSSSSPSLLVSPVYTEQCWIKSCACSSSPVVYNCFMVPLKCSRRFACFCSIVLM